MYKQDFKGGGFAEVFTIDKLNSQFYKAIENKYKNLSNNELNLVGLHKVNYEKLGNHNLNEFVKYFIIHSDKVGKASINKFMKYVKKTGDYESLKFILTTKSEEWEFENEYRLIVPKYVTGRKNIDKTIAREYASSFTQLTGFIREFIVAGDKISKENLASLAFYCEKFQPDTKLSVLNRNFLNDKEKLITAERFKKEKHLY